MKESSTNQLVEAIAKINISSEILSVEQKNMIIAKIVRPVLPRAIGYHEKLRSRVKTVYDEHAWYL